MTKSKTNYHKKTYPHEDIEFWQHHLSQIENSASSKAAYCRAHQLNYDRAQYWFRRIKELDNTTNLQATQPIRPTLVPVTLAQTETLRNDVGDFTCQLQLNRGIHLTITSVTVLEVVLEKVLAHAAIV